VRSAKCVVETAKAAVETAEAAEAAEAPDIARLVTNA
jgi:hypothetical protein